LTLAQLKDHLRVDGTESDDYLTTLISVVRQQAEDRTERTLMPSTWTLRLPAFPSANGGTVELLRPPLVGVSSVQYLDAAGAQQLVGPGTYWLDTFGEPGAIMPLAGSWPATAEHPQAVTIVYTAGYASAAAVPAPIKQWMLLFAGDLYENRAATNIGNIVSELKFADALLAPYRLLGV
jgi:uncharacterized phiE125 gp8 family phage protein